MSASSMAGATLARAGGAAGDLAMFVRVGASLLAVLILVALVARLARRASRNGPGTGLAVLERTGLGKDAAVAVVTVADRVLVIGVTPQTVTMLAELDPQTVPAAAEPRAEPEVADEPVRTKPAGSGSVLSPATWKQALEALRDKTSRT